jgi:phage terminase small subunit
LDERIKEFEKEQSGSLIKAISPRRRLEKGRIKEEKTQTEKRKTAAEKQLLGSRKEITEGSGKDSFEKTYAQLTKKAGEREMRPHNEVQFRRDVEKAREQDRDKDDGRGFGF